MEKDVKTEREREEEVNVRQQAEETRGEEEVRGDDHRWDSGGVKRNEKDWRRSDAEKAEGEQRRR